VRGSIIINTKISATAERQIVKNITEIYYIPFDIETAHANRLELYPQKVTCPAWKVTNNMMITVPSQRGNQFTSSLIRKKFPRISEKVSRD
jgi:hypothetical protein